MVAFHIVVPEEHELTTESLEEQTHKDFKIYRLFDEVEAADDDVLFSMKPGDQLFSDFVLDFLNGVFENPKTLLAHSGFLYYNPGIVGESERISRRKRKKKNFKKCKVGPFTPFRKKLGSTDLPTLLDRAAPDGIHWCPELLYIRYEYPL